jgi:menaquinone-specific isochorismate synthase
MVSDATRRIRRGDLEKVVLARARQLHSIQPIDVVKVLNRLEVNYPNCYRFLFEPIPGHAFYGATPELLAEVTGSQFRTVALAGSIRRGKSTAEDEQLGRQLLTNPKERSEHAFVVETIEENMRPLVDRLHVEARPTLRRLSNIQHIQTPIEGQLAAGHDALSVVEALHPTPALGGRPRKISLDIIDQAEPTVRGWYGGPMGWLDHQGNGTFAVAIRSALSVGHESILFAGAGIVADSEPDREWRETQLKFKPLMDALAGAM